MTYFEELDAFYSCNTFQVFSIFRLSEITVLVITFWVEQQRDAC